MKRLDCRTPILNLGLCVALAIGVAAQAPPLHLPPLDRSLPARAETIYKTMAPRIDSKVAMEIVTVMGPLWRLAGNPDYDRSLDYVAKKVSDGGFTRVDIESFDNAGHGWEQQEAALSIQGDRPEVVLSRGRDRLALCINSFSTPAGGVVLPRVDLGAAQAADIEAKNVKGAVVLGDAPVGGLWTRAVRERGAAGVVSTDLASYTQPDVTPDVLQWGSFHTTRA